MEILIPILQTRKLRFKSLGNLAELASGKRGLESKSVQPQRLCPFLSYDVTRSKAALKAKGSSDWG